MKRLLMTPYGVMSVVLVMYAAKVVTKLSVGYSLNSPMIIGDGYHNFADIFEAGLVILMIWLARRPRTGDYPLGRKNAESIVSAVIGSGLILLSLKLGTESVLGLLSWFPSLQPSIEAINPFQREALRLGNLGGTYFWLALAVTGGSGLVSLLVSIFQIRVGKMSGHSSLEADGEETRSDSYIEFVAMVGVLSEYIFHQPHLEYVFALAVAVKLFLTGKELFLRGFHALLQRSLGEEINQEIKNLVHGMCGIVKVSDLKTFQVGSDAVIILKVHTRCELEATRMMKKSLDERLDALVKSHEFGGAEMYIRFDCPSPEEHREAFVITVEESGDRIAPKLEGATVLCVCDMEDGNVKRTDDVDLPRDLPDILLLICEKKVSRVHVFGTGDELEREACHSVGVQYATVDHEDPAVYKCNIEDSFGLC